MKKTIIITSLFLSLFSFAQETAEKENLLPLPKMSYLDSLKTTFVNHSTSNCIDERWLSELANFELSNDMYNDIENFNIDTEVSYNLSTDLLKKRLAKMDAKSPFNIEYHPALENTIKAFLKNRPKAFERLMAISEYYFPMFEEHLAKYNIPLELKYLAIVESALNPRAKSRVGASGLWQFMYPTGKQYNLEVTSYVDERYDPLKATEAACQYLSSLYGIFGDWSMVLAAYNCGPGNVSKAIRRSGGSQNYWNIRKNLPKETANYVPAFLATFYIYEFKKEHGIMPKKAPLTYFETDTIMVKKQMSFKHIAELLDIFRRTIRIFKSDLQIESDSFCGR
ncbi:transglycosylase-like protein with SLT domain [Flavobacterium aquaticum]|uniref:Transglycosylase-like protein with SLT domain n=1 Tax=Flavobacterium aquaticum TaxID=1236486 RepID=A0A327YRC5_9FLAO|nr:lytic transglycosylase domain-containing protein [Flavobacterium aquaticum]RAK23704.1 transglycosylase-like protein with SLT domain [Flavobacterium aquaticum]